MTAEHEIEPVPGLPARLPPGETILWQGAPAWRPLARRMFRLRLVGGYFAVLLAWRLLEARGDIAAATGAVVTTLAMAAAAVAVLGFIAWAMARATVYTITNRRLVIRSGVAIPMIVNVPFRAVASASLRLHGDGTGDLPLVMKDGDGIAYLAVWPNARPHRFAQAEPMLRCVPDAEEVARILGRALAAAADQQVRPSVSDAGHAPARTAAAIA